MGWNKIKVEHIQNIRYNFLLPFKMARTTSGDTQGYIPLGNNHGEENWKLKAETGRETGPAQLLPTFVGTHILGKAALSLWTTLQSLAARNE